MDFGKMVVDEDVLLIDKRQFMKVFAETLEEVVSAGFESDELEPIEIIVKSMELAEFGAILTYNLFDGD